MKDSGPPSPNHARVRDTEASGGRALTSKPMDGRGHGVTPRVILIIAALLPLNAYWIIHMTTVRYVGFVTIASLFYNTVILLTLLAAANALLKRWAPRYAFSPAELAALYSLFAVATSPPGLDTSSILIPAIVGPFRMASPENGWDRLFLHHLPTIGTMRDKASLEAMWAGDTNVFTQPHLGLWIGPVVFWGLYMTALWTAPLGLAVLFRRRWIEVERLTYPIIQLPSEMCRADGRIWRSKAMWTTLAIAAGINMLNGFNALYPMVPKVPVRWDASPAFDISAMLTDRPWNAAWYVHLAFYPFIIGFGLLLPQDLCFSCWFFFLFSRAQMVFWNWLGMTARPQFPYLHEQAYGAYLGIALFSLWVGRRTLRHIWDSIRSGARDSGEPMSYRSAAALTALCSAWVLGCLVLHGMTWWVALVFFGMYGTATYLIGRIRAEVGIPVHEFDYMSPLLMMGNVLGPKVVGARSLSVMAMHTGYSRGLRNIPFPHECEALKLAEQTGANTRRLVFALGVVVALAMMFSIPATLQIFYRNGVGARMQGFPKWGCQEPYNYLVGWLENPRGVATDRVWAIAAGVVASLGLLAIRVRTTGWPFHPVGLAVGISFYMTFMWCPLLVAWTAKSLVCRYGGSRAVRDLTFAAFGLILGDVLTGGAWLIYGFVRGIPTYAFWH